ncbi:uncharacterized protein LOC120014498 [Tripterygium wilfordii]|nr:uncharacterized protein LOC120014498 [Tripterygium wilfordii]XP_038722390.1 uncharacterized protein LOC120014498 [Tripterygium wilfordii]XP_038722391.1 uncharacterized protein LOC120014498 [Tripterygium wilfordii]
MQPPSRHSIFFSSLRQVEKRLKLELPSHASDPSPPQQPEIDSLSSPIFVHSCQPTTTNEDSALQESSEPPLAFLSPSPQFPPTQRRSTEENPQIGPKVQTDDVDDVERLIRLLGLSEEEEKEKHGKSGSSGCNYADFCGYEDGFYEQIVGVKGPKCRKELERLEGWIRYFSNGCDGGGKGTSEPLRLAFLLLGKAAFLSEDGDGLEFPSAIEEFLKIDPPKD